MDLFYERTVAKFYESALNPGEWPAALQCIADCFDDVGCILIYGREDGTFGVIASPELSQAASEYLNNWSNRDIRAIRAREMGYFRSRVAITDGDVVSQDEIESHPFYVEFLRKFGLKYFAATAVIADTGVEAALSVQRSATKQRYSQDELLRLSALARHAERSLRLGFRLSDNELAAETLGHILSRVDVAIFVLDAFGRVTFSNDLAQSYVGDGVELIGEKLHLRANIASNIPRLHAAALTDIIAEDRGPILVHRQNSSPLVAHVLPVPVGGQLHQPFLTQARSVVLLSDADGVAALLTARSP